ncbi:MAG: hypothetical protein JEY94_06970 [Melioribacteraceae bacterium]|nr:hypothetical protein [Melioribacteraceae bacterium]
MDHDIIKISDINSYKSTIDYKTNVNVVLKMLDENLQWPGVILLKDGSYFGMISKLELFKILGKKFGRELYSNRSIDYLFENCKIEEAVIFESDKDISKAAIKFLTKKDPDKFEPIVIKYPSGENRLIDAHELFLSLSKMHQSMSKSLKEASDFKTEIIRIAAHDLANPLNSIIGFSTMMEEEIKDKEMLTMLDVINSSANRMMALITNLLHSDAMEFGNTKLHPKQIDLNSIIECLVTNYTIQAGKKNQEFRVKLDNNNGISILADEIKIYEVIENLISNAVKYSPVGGKINIELKYADKDALFSIKDEGPGLTEKDKKRVFGKFNRLSAKPTGNEKSTGLGLYIVRQIVNLHKGEVWVESEEKHGSTFYFSLPFKYDKEHVSYPFEKKRASAG